MSETACGCLVVLDSHARVAGILTDRDLAVAVGNTKRNATHVPAHEAMSVHVHTCSPDDNVRDALATMASAKVRRLPVVARDGDLKGVLSIDDLVLWGEQDGGVTQTELMAALRSLFAARAPVAELDTSDV
jgi:IMP dehydrogenase